MHYIILVPLSIPKLQDEPEKDTKIADAIEELKNQKDKSIFSDFYESVLTAQKSAFAKAVADETDSLMDQYASKPRDSSLMVFEDKTSEIENTYRNGATDCIKTPDGRILKVTDSSLWGKYEIHNGIVYKSNWGVLHHRKLTKIAKKMTAFPNYPFSKLYSSPLDYVEKEDLYDYHEEQQAYGYYYNPNAFYDWYSIGGQWNQLFLVKESCTEFSLGSPNSLTKKLEAPEGYRWLCAAKKKILSGRLCSILEFREQRNVLESWKSFLLLVSVRTDFMEL